jgi:chemotaxis protein MotB
MARKRRAPVPENHERWLISYADFITLLFAFFVVMFASSQTDRSKVQQVSDSVKSALEKGGASRVVHQILGGTVDDKGIGNAMMKGPGGINKVPARTDSANSEAELLPSLKYLTEVLASEIRDGKIDIHLEPRGLVLSLREAAFFPPGGDEIAVTGYDSLSKIARTITDLPNTVSLEGHTDSVPIHNSVFHSNWELSAARSIAMLELLSTRFSVSKSRMSIAAFAETVPVDSNETPEGRAHNRRVDLVILNQRISVKSSAPPALFPEREQLHPIHRGGLTAN